MKDWTGDCELKDVGRGQASLVRTLGQEALFWGVKGLLRRLGSIVRVSGFCQRSTGSTGWSGCLSTKPAARSGWRGHEQFRFSLRLNHSVQRR